MFPCTCRCVFSLSCFQDFLFVFGFYQFDYEVSLCIILLRVCGVSWLGGFMICIKFGMFIMSVFYWNSVFVDSWCLKMVSFSSLGKFTIALNVFVVIIALKMVCKVQHLGTETGSGVSFPCPYHTLLIFCPFCYVQQKPVLATSDFFPWWVVLVVVVVCLLTHLNFICGIVSPTVCAAFEGCCSVSSFVLFSFLFLTLAFWEWAMCLRNWVVIQWLGRDCAQAPSASEVAVSCKWIGKHIPDL